MDSLAVYPPTATILTRTKPEETKMDFNVPITCYKCSKDFNAFESCPSLKLLLPLRDEGGYSVTAICPDCKTDCGEISVMLTINDNGKKTLVGT